jgi:protoporphyrinogen oxidase/glycosyltransferase involved in cell wall biosynthesis
MSTVIVFCHLRWDFVFQRPQHLMTRLAQYHNIVFIEEPVYQEGESYLKTYTPAPNITVVQPHTPVQAAGFHDDQIPVLQPLLAKLASSGENPIVWFYTPMALPLLQSLHPSLVVYDCMDELSAFKNAPKQLLQRETALLNIADVVFTGGPSLYEAKKTRHANAHCFASSVDVAHFARALDRATSHPEQGAIPAPRLGFYGVIDERFDTELLGKLAAAHPEWQLVMVGPVLKIDPLALPKAPNIHYLGQHSYDDLPRFLAGWDLALLPFALNESTRFISPTKVLEYMAAELPIVSTAITDVKKPYAHVVAVADDHDAFIRACEAVLAQSPEARSANVEAMRAVVANTSWDRTVEDMVALMRAASHGNKEKRTVVSADPSSAPEASDAANVNALRKPTVPQTYKAVIIGAGPTGLSCAYHYGKDALLLDRNPVEGGWCRSVEDKGFTFDYAGHIMFSNDPYVLKLYDKLLGDNLHWQNREAWVYSKNTYTRYPFQGALYGLPPDVIKECIMGAIEARYGAAGARPAKLEKATPVGATLPKVAAAAACDKTAQVEDCCADGTVEIAHGDVKDGTIKTADEVVAQGPQNFEEFIYKVWGAGIAKHFAIPYNRKIWTVPLTEMETSWLGGRVPLPDLEEIIDGALQPVAKPMGPNARFGYPLKGGFQALVSAFVPHIAGKIEQNAEVVQVIPSERIVALSDGRRFRYDHLVSTMPLPELVRVIGTEAPEAVRMAAKGLNHISIRCVNIGVKRPKLTDKHWIYYPDQAIFHRIFVQGNASPYCNAEGGFGLTCEISYSPWKPLPCDGEELTKRAIADCIAVGIFNEDDEIMVANQVDMPYAYVVYDHQRAANVKTIRDWLLQHNIILSGRYSEWEYYNSDHAFIAGKRAAEIVLERQSAHAAAAGGVRT